jgi:hypothetical protein
MRVNERLLPVANGNTAFLWVLVFVSISPKNNNEHAYPPTPTRMHTHTHTHVYTRIHTRNWPQMSDDDFDAFGDDCNGMDETNDDAFRDVDDGFPTGGGDEDDDGSFGFGDDDEDGFGDGGDWGDGDAFGGDGEEWGVDDAPMTMEEVLENQYREAIEKQGAEAAVLLEALLADEDEKTRWGFKSLKKLVKINQNLGEPAKARAFFQRMMAYVLNKNLTMNLIGRLSLDIVSSGECWFPRCTCGMVCVAGFHSCACVVLFSSCSYLTLTHSFTHLLTCSLAHLLTLTRYTHSHSLLHIHSLSFTFTHSLTLTLSLSPSPTRRKSTAELSQVLVGSTR